MAGFLALCAVNAFQFRAIETARETGKAETCQGFIALDNQFVKLIRTGEKEATTLAYYKEHPQDLRTVIKVDENAISVLVPPDYCK